MRAEPGLDRASVQWRRGPLHYFLCLLCMIPVATAVGALVLMATRALYPPLTPRNGTSCCEEYVALLSAIVNESVNPCESIYDFMCGLYSVQAAPGALFDTQELESAWGYKPSNTLASRLAYQYYRSCVISTVQGEGLGAETATALLGFLGSSVNFLPRLIVEISLKYVIKFPVRFLSENMFDLWKALRLPARLYFNVYDIAVTLNADPEPKLSTQAKQIYLRIRRDALHRVNEALSLNVSEREIDEIGMALRVRVKRVYVSANLTDLRNLVPTLTVGEWRALLQNVTRSEITGNVFFTSDVATLKRSLDILLDAPSRPKSVVFSIVEATSRLLSGAVLERDNTDMRQRYFLFCQKASYRTVGPFLILHLIEKLKAGKLHDTLLRAHFRAIKKAISERAATIVAGEDIEPAKRYVQQKRLLLPSEVFSRDLPLPKLSNDYAQNYLLMHESQWTLYSIAMPGDIPRFTALTAMLGKLAVMYNDVVILPVSAYSNLNITSRLDPVVPLATLGVMIADAIWRGILHFDWSESTRLRLESRRQCLIKEGRIKHSVRFFHPELSLDSALDAARRKDWHDKLVFYSYRLQRTSRSQLFFLLFLFHYYCPTVKHVPLDRRRFEANHLFLHSDDFREAFGCSANQSGSDSYQCGSTYASQAARI